MANEEVKDGDGNTILQPRQNNDDTTSDAVAVVPHDTNPNKFQYLYVGTGGNVQIVTPKGSTTLYKNVPSGSYIDAQTAIVMATNTTALDIVGHRA